MVEMAEGAQPGSVLDGSTKAERAYRALHRMIVTMELPPGSILDEREFAARFGIGRTPLREAVERLVEQHLIVASPHRPSQVAPLELTQAQAICELRMLLEPHAARLGAQRAGPEGVRALEEVLERYRSVAAAGDVREAIDVDFAFHDRLARCTGNAYLVDCINRLNALSQRLWFLSLRILGHLEPIVHEHEAIVTCVRERDPEGADRAMRAHIESFRERVRKLL